VRRVVPLILGLVSVLSGCSPSAVWAPTTTSVIPSSSGIPNSVASLGNYEFVSEQGVGQIFTYNVSTGAQVLAAPAYTTPCMDPSGMVTTTVAGTNVMAVVCYDTSSLLTLTVHADGSLSPLGSVTGLPIPYPGIALNGTDVFVPLFGKAAVANGAVARVSIAVPANPAITGVTSVASPAPGQFVNPSYLAIAGQSIYIVAGSESPPQVQSSTIQVMDKSAMTLVGSPFLLAHSPQQIAIQGTVALVTLYDASQLESIDISQPASLQLLEIAPLASANTACHARARATSGQLAYVGCYEEATVEQVDTSNPSNLRLTQIVPGISSPQRILPVSSYLLVPSSTPGGRVYDVPRPSNP
jgi:hypothetical protein